MATAQQIRDQVDAKLANLWTAIQTKENSYFAANGRYFQGLKTHTLTPKDGAETTPDVGTKTPHYQPDPWPLAIRNTAMPMTLEIHQYVTPDGTAGYQASVTVQIGADIWERTAQVGPETYRQHGWQKVTPVV